MTINVCWSNSLLNSLSQKFDIFEVIWGYLVQLEFTPTFIWQAFNEYLKSNDK